jgi:pimeloyl-ACP methyl ester carboxylesterase
MLKHRVISVCVRGHGPNRDAVEDFSFADHARDALALVDNLSVDSFVCIAASHGAWPALEISQMLGRQRMPAIIILDLAMEELSPQFVAALKYAIPCCKSLARIFQEPRDGKFPPCTQGS